MIRLTNSWLLIQGWIILSLIWPGASGIVPKSMRDLKAKTSVPMNSTMFTTVSLLPDRSTAQQSKVVNMDSKTVPVELTAVKQEKSKVTSGRRLKGSVEESPVENIQLHDQRSKETSNDEQAAVARPKQDDKDSAQIADEQLNVDKPIPKVRVPNDQADQSSTDKSSREEAAVANPKRDDKDSAQMEDEQPNVDKTSPKVRVPNDQAGQPSTDKNNDKATPAVNAQQMDDVSAVKSNLEKPIANDPSPNNKAPQPNHNKYKNENSVVAQPAQQPFDLEENDVSKNVKQMPAIPSDYRQDPMKIVPSRTTGKLKSLRIEYLLAIFIVVLALVLLLWKQVCYVTCRVMTRFKPSTSPRPDDFKAGYQLLSNA